MNFFNKYLTILAAIGLMSFLEAVEVRASVDANSVNLSDVFTFKVEAVDADQTPNVDISPLLKYFSIVSGPGQQTNIQWINGRMTSSRSLTWTLVAKQPGSVTIPSLTIAVGGKKVKTNPIQMKVQGTGRTSSRDELYISVEVDNREAYVGEQVTVTYKLYTRVNMSLQSIDYPKGTGFWIEDLRKPSPPRFRDTNIGGVRTKVTTLYTAALFPTKTGQLSLDPMTVNCQVEVSRKRSRDPFFDSPFFNSFFNETVRKVIRSESVTISVKPLPPGKPANFTGAVGSFTLESALDTDNVSVNEAVTMRVRLSGTGNLNLFSPPKIEFPPDVDVLPPTSTFEKEALRDQLTGTINWEYILIPRSAGRLQMPRIELAYFDPDAEEWKQTRAPALIVTVNAGKSSTTTMSGLSRDEVRLLAEDIRYIRTDPPQWRGRDSSGMPAFIWITYGLALLLFAAPVPLERFKSSYIQTAGLRQSKAALKSALKSLKGIREDPYTETSKVVTRYLKEKFMLRTEAIDQIIVADLLSGKIDPSLLERLIDLLSRCDEGRFAPGGDDSQIQVVEDAREILIELDWTA